MNSAALRTLIIYAIILPLAVFVGMKLSGNMTTSSLAMLGFILFVLVSPVILKWHYPVLVFSWSSSLTLLFLPGKPGLWMLMAVITFSLAILNRIVQKQPAFIPAPSITIPLLLFGAVVLITAKLRGGFGVQSLGGSTQGGKPYYYLLGGLLGYFAFASQPIPLERAKLYFSLFFLSGLVSIGSILIYKAGQPFYFLFLIFPMGAAAVQAISEYSGSITRIAGLTVATSSVGYYLLGRFGIRGILQRWSRILLLLLVLALGALGGYRSVLVSFGLTFVILFIAEGLLRSPLFPALLLMGALAFAALIPLAPKLPLSIQRSLSFLPLPIQQRVRMDAEGSLEWRFQIWRTTLPELPKYVWLGKGYAINPTELYLAQQAELRNRTTHGRGHILTGDFHSGPLSLFVPFGAFGTLAFLAFLIASLRALYLNYRYGSDELRLINRFLFAYFCSRVIFFFAAFGVLAGDFAHFAGIIGFSVALNKGICRKPVLIPKPVQFRGNLELRGSASPA